MFKRLVILVTAGLFLMSISAMAKIKKEDFNIPKDDISILALKASFGAAEVSIQTADMDEIAKGTIEYDSRDVEVYADYDRDEEIGFLDLGSEVDKKVNMDTEDNIWDVTLSTKYETELELEIGASRSEIDLGGMQIKQLSLEVGAADGELTFSKPNPVEMEYFKVESGAAKFYMEKIGNANFKRMSFEGGVGKFELDFSGEYKTKSKVRIEIGLGSAVLLIPKNLPIRIEADDTFLSSIDFKGGKEHKVDDDYYESDDYRDSDIGLSIDISVGLGSVDIKWVD